jgi:hypothetical protein
MSPTGHKPRTPASEPSAAVIEQAVRKVLTELGAANLRERALGYGTLKDGENVGKQNAVAATIRLSGPGEYEVPHKLGTKPVLCELKKVVSAVGATPVPHASASPVRESEWTETTCRVNIILTSAGTLSNTVATFIIKGA